MAEQVVSTPPAARRDSVERRGAGKFTLAGALMGAGGVQLVLLLVAGWVLFPLMVLTVATAGGCAAVGALNLSPRARHGARRLAQVAAAFLALAGSGALLLVTLIPVGFVAVEITGLQWPIVELLFAVGLLVLMGGLLVGLPLTAAALSRGRALPGAVAGGLLVAGLLLLVPVAQLLTGAIPDWVAVVLLAGWSGLFLWVGRALRTGATTRLKVVGAR